MSPSLSNGSSEVYSAPSLFKLDHRTIIVSGALGSLGVAITRTLLQHGADVVCTDLSPSAPAELWLPLASVAKQYDTVVTYLPCDVTNEENVASTFAKAKSTSRNPIRGLVTCAGISGRCPAVDYPIETFRKIVDINLTGTFISATAAAKIMHRQNVSGSIVMFASMSGTNVNKGVNTCAYNASKAGVLQLARNLAAEWGKDTEHPPIRVNTISPGYILTPMTIPTFEILPELKTLWPEGNMLGRMSDVEEHLSSVVYLLSDSSSYTTAMDLKTDAGHTAW